MHGDGLDFSGDVVADRAAVLLDAARRIDSLTAHLGDEDSDEGEPDAGLGDLIRGFTEDRVEFAATPDVYPVPILNLPDADQTSAAWQAARQEGFSFWWIRIPLLLFPRRNWAFSRLEVRVEFNADERDPLRKPKAFDILPNRRFDTVMQAGVELTVGIGADGHFAVGAGAPGALPIGANANAEAGFKVNLGFSPMKYRVVAAKVDHTAEGLAKVFWRLDGKEFFQENPPQLIVILQVPKAAAGVDLRAVLRAYRRFNLFPAGLQSIIFELPEAMMTFFRRGAPIQAVTRYDLSSITSV